MGMIGMAQVLATQAYGIKGLRRGISTWNWPKFHQNPQQENQNQMDRWSLNRAPSWNVPPLAIANRYIAPKGGLKGGVKGGLKGGLKGFEGVGFRGGLQRGA